MTSASTPTQFNAAAAVTGAPQDEILHKLALDLNENLPEIYLWQPNYLHVYSEKLGGDFAIYPERARVLPEDPRLDLHAVTWSAR